ncbi:MAG: OmpH family outer membrane protein [Bacteroidales bacterium]|jgi:outer membrane protein|nr:OmpH family outer membrane protein [Bacteroidales bacterium]
MKKSIITAVLVAFLALPMFGQKYAYIDSEYILSNMPDYVEAQAELDRVALEWQQEIEKEFAKIDSMYKKYQTEVITLPENMKQKREEAIINAEKAAKDLQKKRFGKDGDLTKKREELVTPIQDRVFTAIDEYAKEKGYAFVFDVAGSMTIIYADPKWDINDQIMQKLGVTARDDSDDDE